MEFTLANEYITVVSKDKGAELCSIKSKSSNLEYLWQADPAFWNRHAPVLFPIVGRLRDDKTIIAGKEYSMTQHGFARDMIFEVVEHSSSTITYRITSSEETKKRYPYDFALYIGYMLRDNQVEVSYRVENKDKKNIFFSIGAHPGFNCPLEEGENFEDYYLEFDKEELISSFRLRNGVVQERKELLFDTKVKNLKLSKDLFKEDAIMLEDTESAELSLKSGKTGRGITVNYKGFPYLGIWSKPDGAPFVCIEPWFGIADFAGSSGIYEEKKGIMELKEEEGFSCSFIIKIF